MTAIATHNTNSVEEVKPGEYRCGDCQQTFWFESFDDVLSFCPLCGEEIESIKDE